MSLTFHNLRRRKALKAKEATKQEVEAEAVKETKKAKAAKKPSK